MLTTQSTHPLALWCRATGTRRSQLAREFRVHRSYLTHIIAGRRRPKLFLRRLSIRTGIPLDKLMAA